MSTPPLPPDSAPIRLALSRLAAAERLGEALAAAAFGQIMRGEVDGSEAAALLMALRVQGERDEEIAGAVRALREAMVRVAAVDAATIDTCGTGGGDVPTFNVSTAAAIVAVAVGARVAKHGNRSYTSRCGSADLLEALGIDIALDATRAATLLERVGMAFLFAPAFHPAMRHLAPVRRALGVPTIMNLVGPLANPAGVRRQVVGVADARRAPAIAAALARLGADHALVVHAEVGMDEIAPHGVTHVWEIAGDRVVEWPFDPASTGLAHAELESLAGGAPEENAARVRRLFDDAGADPAGRAAVALNAGAALYVAGLAENVEDGALQAAAAIDDGRAASALRRIQAESAVRTSE